MRKVRIVSATTKNEKEFKKATPLGQSLGRIPKPLLPEINVLCNNHGSHRTGLSKFYNSFLQAKYEKEILVLVHDDVYLNDWHIVQRIIDAAAHFDIIGLAGNTSPDLGEPSWALGWNRAKYPSGWQPKKCLSGSVAHPGPKGTEVSYYGEAPQTCQLLDGLFLAIRTERVLASSVRFDEQFDFHFYDLDFCRQCHNKGLRLGTWPIAVSHASGGTFGTPEWVSAKEKYALKWQGIREAQSSLS